jgi:acylphosphatase
MLVRATLIVKGTIRTAGYREDIHRQAIRLGLTGLFEQLGDGNIRIVVEGEKERVNEFISSLNQGGRPAHFSGFDIEFRDPEGRYESFIVAGT